MEGKKSLDEVNQQLDDIIIQFFECLGELYQEQANLETYMKNGYLMMSRARYSMGVKSVGISQYDENNMKATKVVIVNTENDCNNDDKTFQLVNSNNSLLDTSSDTVSEGLRQRKVTDKVETITHGSEMTTKKKNAQANVTDPIKWFGVLVPQALRQSQGYFKQALDCAVTVSNLKSKVIFLKEQYKTLRKEKQVLS